MFNLLHIGRIFYGLAIAALGFQTIYYNELPYMLLPADYFHGRIVTSIAGIIFLFCAACIVFQKKAEQVSLLFGVTLLLIFLFYFVPYQFFVSKNYLSFGEWENAEKELALAAGAFVMANSLPSQNKNGLTRFLRKPAPFGAPVFAIIIFCFGILHFLYAVQASSLVPSWIPNHLFWIYFAGVALLGSGIAIVLKIKTGLIATLLGIMIFTWFVCLHIPRVIAAPAADMPGEVTSALIAFAYSGTAFMIAGSARRA